MASTVQKVNVKFLFFAKAKEIVKKAKESSPLVVPLPSKFDNVKDLFEKVESEFPELKTLDRCFVFALNENYLDETDDNDQSEGIILKDGDELAIIPPLSGG